MKSQKKSPFAKPNRFDLEQALLVLWGSAEDVMLFFEHYYEHHESMSADDVANTLLGLHQLIHMRGQKAFNIFESLVHENPKKSVDTI
jgi:hypothetical protein